MPKRKDLHTILIIGSGPIVIGQACEFDYSGTQACHALREEGYKVVLLNSNPATIMTDPTTADVIYLEPLTVDSVEKILKKENIDAILPTMGGQTALNLAIALEQQKILKKFNIKLIGVSLETIYKTENRQLFRQCLTNIGLDCLTGYTINSLSQAKKIINKLAFPVIIRPSFTLGGFGGKIINSADELLITVIDSLKISPINQILIEGSVIGWKEFELEVIRDHKDQCIVVCAIENIDPMGIHTGDSISVAPPQTLTDKEYQQMRNTAFAVIRAVGLTNGGANVQFAVNPITGRMVVIEMNPRVSRSSALASKATGFPIAKVAAKLAVNLTLDEIEQGLTAYTGSAFEPSIDYVVTKIPYFDFAKLGITDPELNTYMQSIGEVMAIGRTFPESLQKALRSLGPEYIGPNSQQVTYSSIDDLLTKISSNTPLKLFYITAALREKLDLATIQQAAQWDLWFLQHLQQLMLVAENIRINGLPSTMQDWRFIKSLGFSDDYLAELTNTRLIDLRQIRENLQVHPIFRQVDTCAAEFSIQRNYLYSTYLLFESSISPTNICESNISSRKKVIILGSGANRIGQGIEFDYCCVHAIIALKQLNIEAIMINCNPATVSTDYAIPDKLYFLPLTVEDILDVIRKERSQGEFLGILVQFGGQTAINLAFALAPYNIPILGTDLQEISTAENRQLFRQRLLDLNLKQPKNLIADSKEELIAAIQQLPWPIILRPSFVLGGSGMVVLHNSVELDNYLQNSNLIDLFPVLVEQYLLNALELDIDVLSDGEQIWIAGILEQFEPLGIHSGDSTAIIPPRSLSAEMLNKIKLLVTDLVLSFNVRGALNIQLAVLNGNVYVIELNPRASRTMPFVAKALGVPIIQYAVYLALGYKLADIKVLPDFTSLPFTVIKQPVFSFDRIAKADARLGPRMQSTGEVMEFSRY